MRHIKTNELPIRRRKRKLENQVRRGLIGKKKPKGSGRLGYNSYKFNIFNNSDGIINTLDLGGVSYDDTEKVIDDKIKNTIKEKNFPLRVITHSVVDKIISFRNVIKRYDNLKELSLDPTNPFTFSVVPK